MSMNAFSFVTPASVQEALQQLERGATFKAGGVDLLDRMKEGIDSPQKLVNIRHIRGLDQIAETADGLRIGPMVTLAQIAESPVIRKQYPALAEAAERAATPQIRNMATAGGNLLQRPRCWYFRHEDFHCRKKGGDRCFAQEGENQYHAIFDNTMCAIIHPSGLAVPLVALGASIELTTAKGRRSVELEKFFILPDEDVTRENKLAAGEMLTGILVPAAAAKLRNAYIKQGEKDSADWPIADVAVALEMQGNTCQRASIVLGAASPVPRRAAEAEVKLKGATIDESSARAAAEAAMQYAQPMSENAYKVQVFKAVIRRTILQAAGKEWA